ncbi:MAG: elongation factor P [Candidatus Gracilibacteria bacterium]
MAQSITDLRVGSVLVMDNAPFQILSTSFMRTAQRKPVMRTKLKNLLTGGVMEKTFVSGENFEFADVARKNVQYLYKDAEEAYFMDNENYEQFSFKLADLGDMVNYLQDGKEMTAVLYNEKPISLQLPPKVVLKVVETTPGVRGDRAQSGTKPAKMDTGAVINVPLFIEEGDLIRVNTETGEYVERANG